MSSFASPNARLLLAQLATCKGRYAVGLVFLAAADGGQLASAWLVGRAFDALEAETADPAVLARFGLAILGAALVVSLARFGWRHAIFGSGRRIERALRQRLHDHLLRLSPRFHQEHKVGALMAHATNDVQAVQLAASNGMMSALDAGILFLGALFMMGLTVDWSLTLVALLPLLLLTPTVIWLGRRLHARFAEVQAQFGVLSEQVQENVAGVRVVKGFAQEPVQAARFEAANEDYRGRYLHMLRYDRAFEAIIGLLIGLSFAIGLGYGGTLVVRGEISLGSYVAFNTFLGLIAWPMMALGFMTNHFQRATASLGRLERIFETPVEIADGPEARPYAPAGGGLSIRGLTFRYEERLPLALDGLDLELAPGGTVGILGRTGSGKSTLASLLVRWFDPPTGSIYLDGQDLREIRLADLRAAIAAVPQEAFLFSTTIAENIAFAPEADPADRAAIEAAARLAGVHEDISGFPKGYDTLLGERGITLSGGQRQRVSLARALLRDAPLLVLDDALSAVDTETEARILSGLRDHTRERSTVIIAHRVSAVQHADEILVLEEGRVVERGDHESLLEANGRYAALHRKQQRDEALRAAGGEVLGEAP